ncbi:MAG: SUMF1/EgtB/PvdO family nonheme iron enzyme [Chloroflexi bacterium]|nr:SUMF1/EgtB/PvdO family nonheme iron enzyme [Chloroflexota bacterium]
MPQKNIRVFISYRRDDSQYVTDSIHDHLMRHFGEENVFLDVQNIPFGVDFRKHLASQVAAHDVVLVIIGPDWARIMQERATQPNDFVRIEVESALQQGKLIIPVLVMETQMPDFSVLPPSIADLQWLQTAIIRRKPDLEHDCVRLADGIRYSVLPSSLDILPPPFNWIDIPAGQVTLEDGHDKFEVPAFTVAKYPVTVAQYEVFMKDGGYTTPQWWTKGDWQWLQKQSNTAPRYWNNEKWQSLGKPDHPVVGVSWFEACAFTRWLSDQSGEHIYLPTEQQWQRAAQGNDGRKFPWGNEWEVSRCNNDTEYGDFGDTKKKADNTTSSVTAYEGKGDSPFSVVDMAGNVWEWTKSAFETAQTVNLEDTTTLRVVRGGSWSSNLAENFRITFRHGFTPGIRLTNQGFRVIRSQF